MKETIANFCLSRATYRNLREIVMIELPRKIIAHDAIFSIQGTFLRKRCDKGVHTPS
jgi:hypothetical protein